MRKFQQWLFVLKRSYICYYVICMTAPLKSQPSKLFLTNHFPPKKYLRKNQLLQKSKKVSVLHKELAALRSITQQLLVIKTTVIETPIDISLSEANKFRDEIAHHKLFLKTRMPFRMQLILKHLTQLLKFTPNQKAVTFSLYLKKFHQILCYLQLNIF